MKRVVFAIVLLVAACDSSHGQTSPTPVSAMYSAHPGVELGINAIPCRAFRNGWDCHFYNQQRALDAARAYGPPRRMTEHGFQPFLSTVPERRPFKGFVVPGH